MEQPLTATQLDIAQKAYKHAEQLRYQGYAATDILKELESQGMERSAAQTILARLYTKSDTAARENALKVMLVSGVTCFLGILITVGTFNSGLGFTVVTYGAIFGGGYKFLEALYTYIKS
jgi:hypothetical protein